MSKMMKRIVIIMAVVFLWKPVISEAAFTASYPETKFYIELVDRFGNDVPINIGMEAKHIKGFHSAPSTTITPSSIVQAPVNKVGGKNIFEFTVPAFHYTINAGRYWEGFADAKINTPLTFVKNITPISPDGTPASIYRMTNQFEFESNPKPPWGYSLLTHHRFVKQSDSTFNLPLDMTNMIIGGYYYNGTASMPMRTIDANYSGQPALWVTHLDGDTLRYYLYFYQVKEVFEDQNGASIPTPSGYTNGNLVDIISQPFGYQMANDSSLPQSYVDSGFIYTFKGWYKGVGNKVNIVTTFPPSINFNADLNESANEVHIVYNKRAVRTLIEEYVDLSENTIEATWNSTQSIGDGDTFTQAPAATKTDSSGIVWEYQGWKLDTEPMSAMRTTPVSHTINANTTIQYVYKKKQHSITEKWVDQSDGATLIPMTGNPKTSPIDDNDNFSGTASATITDTHGAIWDFVGWENVTDNAGIVNPSASYAVNTIKAAKEIRYHYQARNTTATLDLNPTPQVTASGGSVSWSSRLTNTGTSTLNNLKLKATSNWASGLSAPTQVTVTPAGGAPQNFTVTPVDWVGGFNLTGINVPNGGPNNYADITFTDTATGAVNQVLPAEIEIDGNMANSLKAENFVRIDDPDEPNLKPLGNAGLINIPDFRFGDVEVKPFAQTKGLDAASYQAGYKPYIRFKDQESLSGWSLTTKLGQFISGSKTLPATTSIQLKNGDLKEVQNYNKSNESLSSVSSIGNKVIASDSTTVALTNGAAQGVYQLDYAFNDVELELLAHSGIAGLSYTADMDWTLTTAP